jgi:hypothetical protein
MSHITSTKPFTSLHRDYITTAGMILFTLIVLTLHGCNTQNRKLEEYKVYEDPETGWITRYPASYHTMTDEEMTKLEQKGLSAMEETLDQEIDTSHKNLLWLSKDQFNSFTSNSQSYDSLVDGPYKESQEFVYLALEETYNSQGIQFDASYGSARIDGLEFSTAEYTVYTPDRKKVLLNQVIYDRLINGNISLTLNINYNNDKDKAILLDVINSSKFTKRN